MDLRRLRMFIAVAEQGSITKAAKYLHMEQPPLSRQIASMEEELGVKLFSRSRRGTNITELGSLFLKKAILLLRERDNLLNYIKTLKRSRDKMIRIGFSAGVLNVEKIVIGLKKTKDIQPNVQFELISGNAEDLTERLLNHDLDIILMWGSLENKSIKLYKISEEEMYAAIARKKMPEMLSRVTLADLCSEDLILFPREVCNELYDAITKSISSIGGKTVIRPISPEINCLPPLVAAGLGNAIVPLSITKTYIRDISYFPMEPRMFCQILAAVRKEVPSQLVKLFVHTLRK
ncbi:LysR family transcriptional regulator [Asaia sp. As-1742]|uniref:LysR family transcriptional regulator n=1 Tax=Asaia sp. As-1742 TaxID=2608325 RepID=UPI00141DB562|nr:LysR family transcriptional regulator [Asaia sp. As-1742]NIE81776.1 LysR family transcriptional regulator [Asaia sp. As-1742]